MFKKLALASVLALSVTASCFAAKVESNNHNSKIFQDSDYKISVQLPEGFDYSDDKGENVVVAAEDKKGGYYKIVAVEAEPNKLSAATDKEALDKLKEGFKEEYTSHGMTVYNDYTIKINPNRIGYFMEGFTRGNAEYGKVKNSVIKFYHNNKLFTVTLRAPYEKKGYLKSFKRFRTSITCKN